MKTWENTCMCVFFTKTKHILRMFVVVLILQDTVAKKCEDNEEDGEDHPFVIHSSLGLNAIIHHHVPVFSCQNLKSNTYKLHLRSEELKWLPLIFISFLFISCYQCVWSQELHHHNWLEHPINNKLKTHFSFLSLLFHCYIQTHLVLSLWGLPPTPTNLNCTPNPIPTSTLKA